MKKWLILFFLVLVTPALAIDIYEPDDSYHNSTYLETNWSRQLHSFDYPGDQDYINFTAIAGSRYIIETFNQSDIDITDTIVDLYSTDGTTLITSNDDIIFNLHLITHIRTSRIIWDAPANGTYFLKVTECNGSSGGSYEIAIVRLGKLEPFLVNPEIDSENQLGLLFNFTTGVKCAEGYCLNISAYLDPEEVDAKENSNVKQEVLDEINNDGSANVIITFSDKDSIKNEISKLSKVSILNSKKDFKVKHQYSNVPMVAGEITNDGLEKLRKNPDVLSIDIDRKFQIQLDSSIPVIGANQVWPTVVNNSNLTGIDQTICIIDTGVNYSHSAFGSCTRTSNINDGSCAKVVGGYDFVNNDNDPYDDHGHGTHVSGIAASEDPIYRGVAPGSKIVSIKVLDSSGSGDSSDVIAGIEWCTNNAAKFNISVISMSLGDSSVGSSDYCNSEVEAASINNAILNNIIVVAAAGNEHNYTSLTIPACIENVTSVSAVDDSDNFASFSDRGFILDLVAPGVSITSPYRGGTTTWDGTSMATPHVAGAAAIIQQIFRLSHNRIITPKELTHLLRYNGLFLNDAESQTVIPRLDVERAAVAKGLIPTTEGAKPFYTLSSNPQKDGCLDFIREGETCNQTWIVNTTGEINSTWEFFAIYEGKYNFNITNAVNITIISVPNVVSIESINQTDVLELGNLQQILVNISGKDLFSVNISMNNSNFTMNLINGLYNYSYVPFENGTVNYTIYAADIYETANYTISGFIVNDTSLEPLIYEIKESGNTVSFDTELFLSAIILDGLDLTDYFVNYNGSNVSMDKNSKFNFSYKFKPNFCGNNSYKIYVQNSANYSAAENGSFIADNCCGNSVCESGESCSSCPNDCGSCPTAPSSSSNGGGGGGGISRPLKINKKNESNLSIVQISKQELKINQSKGKNSTEQQNPSNSIPTGASVSELNDNKLSTKKIILYIAIFIVSLAIIVKLIYVFRRKKKKGRISKIFKSVSK